MTRGGRTKNRDEPERRCIVTRETGPKSGLIRFVVDGENRIVPDLAEKLPGRGIWVSADAKALETARAKNHFSKAAKQAVTVSEDLPEQVETLLVRRMTDTLSLARKAGQAVAGYEKVRDWLDKEEAAALLQAFDGSEGSKKKLRSPGKGTYIDCLSANELGVAFGREIVVHAALKAGGLASLCLSEAARLKGVRRAHPSESDARHAG